MHLRFGMIWAAVATILVGLGTSAEQSRSARLLGSEVPAKRKLRSDNLINDNKEERTPDFFGFEDFLLDKFPETIDDVLSPVLHQHSDPAVPAVAKFHPPPHQQFDGAVSTFPHQQFDAAVSTFPHQQFDDATLNFDDHFFSWLQQFDDATSTVPHQPFADTVSTIPHQPFADTVSTVPHQQFDDATSTVLHQPSDAAVSTVSQQPVLTFDEPFKYSHKRSDDAVFTLDALFLPQQQGSDAAVGKWTHLPMFTFDEHYLSPHQHSDAAVPTIDEFHVPYNDVKGQLDIVYKYLGATDARDRHAQWLENDIHPADVMRRLKFLEKKNQLIVQIPTFRLIYYVDQYSKKHPSPPMKLLGVLKNKNYDEEAVIKSVCLPNMDKEVIDQTSGMVKVQDSESDSASASASQKNFEAALIKVQQYAKTRLTQELIQSWLGDRLSVATVIVRLGLSPKALDTGYDFSRYKILVMYEINWNLRYRPKTFTSLQANALMKLWGYTLKDFKIFYKQSDQDSALSLALAKWIRTQETGNANVSGKKRKERES